MRLSQVPGQRAEYAVLPLLVTLAESGPMRSSDLAEAVFSDRSTVSRQVAHLVELGLVERCPDPADRRACRLVVTEAGAKTLDLHRRSSDDYLARLTGEWSARDLHTLAALVDRLAAEFTRNLHEGGHDDGRAARPASIHHRQEGS